MLYAIRIWTFIHKCIFNMRVCRHTNAPTHVRYTLATLTYAFLTLGLLVQFMTNFLLQSLSIHDLKYNWTQRVSMVFLNFVLYTSLGGNKFIISYQICIPYGIFLICNFKSYEESKIIKQLYNSYCTLSNYMNNIVTLNISAKHLVSQYYLTQYLMHRQINHKCHHLISIFKYSYLIISSTCLRYRSG